MRKKALANASAFLLFVVSGSWLVGNVRLPIRPGFPGDCRGRSLTSQTAFGGQLPYKGSLGRPAVIFDHSLFRMMVSFYELRTTSNEPRTTSNEPRLFLGFRCGVPPRQTQTDNDASGSPQRVAGRLSGRPLRKRSGGPPADCNLRPAACVLRMAFSPNSISRDSHNGTPFGRPLRYRIQAMK